MDQGTRLALRAIVQGLRRSGQIGDHSMKVIVDELRYAAQDAEDLLFDDEARQITTLAGELQAPRGIDMPQGGLQRTSLSR